MTNHSEGNPSPRPCAHIVHVTSTPNPPKAAFLRKFHLKVGLATVNRPLPQCSCGCKEDTIASQKMKRTEKGRSQNWLTHARARGFPSVDLCAWAQRHATSACAAGSTVTGRTSHCGLHWVSSQINGPAPTGVHVRRWTTNDQHRLYCCCSAVIKQTAATPLGLPF